MVKDGWMYCPICNNKTRTKIRPDTVARNLPVFCPKCKNVTVIDTGENNISDFIKWIEGKKYITVDENSDKMTEEFEKEHAWELSRNTFINECVRKLKEYI